MKWLRLHRRDALVISLTLLLPLYVFLYFANSLARLVPSVCALVCRHLHSLSPVESQPGGDDDTKGQLKRSARHNANERRQSV